MIKLITRHLVNDILKWNEKEIKEKWNLELIKKWKLGGACSSNFKDSPYQMLDAAFPNRFEPWELKKGAHNCWKSKEEALKVFRDIVQNLNLSTEDIKEQYSLRWVVQQGLRTSVQKFFGDSPYEMLNAAFPGQFDPWDLKVAPNKTWMNKEEAITVIRNEIEKSGISISELCGIGVRKWMIEKKMITPFNKFWNESPTKMLAELYPEKFIDYLAV
ncbi:hypothetical protein [Bacillus mycoides]|uniref:hypothetical protein n=1 Tax=Bacillus mycoides TaxID=1405 RepID=UPI002078D5D7|nr:hypothetical protein [Bacillus mycoides]